MMPGQENQLEKLVDVALKNGNFQPLDEFLQEDIIEETKIKCSKLFLSKLDKLVNKGLKGKDVKSASVGFTILYKCGKNLSIPGGQGLPGMISQGLVKMLWICSGLQRDETLLNLADDFFDSVMVVHTANIDGLYQITESLLYPIGQLAADPRVYILIQREAIRKLNIILDKIPVEFKKEKKILSSQDASDVMMKMAGQVLEAGDYDFQIALMEALCRMATPDQRKEMADRWFTMEYVARAFVKIRDSEFETDCRKFLNMVNGMHGDRRRVYSYPCLEAYLDKHELLMPSDEKLEEFWIDFNLRSQSISFYFSLADEESEENNWDTLCITDNQVHSYTVTEEGRRKVLRVKLLEVACVGVVEGSSLTVHFSSSLDVLQAVGSVFGHAKNKVFVGKSSTSVVKTTVKILMDDSGSQAIPESQMSMLTDEKIRRPTAPCWQLAPPAAFSKASTPAMRRISASMTYITSSTAGSGRGTSPFSAVMPADTPSRLMGKPALEMVCSHNRQKQLSLGELKTTAKSSSHSTTPRTVVAESKGHQPSKASTRNTGDKYKKCIPLEAAVKMVQADKEPQEPLDHNFVPDTQPTKKTDRSILPQWNKLSVTEMIIPTQKTKYLPRGEAASIKNRPIYSGAWDAPGTLLGPSWDAPGTLLGHLGRSACIDQSSMTEPEHDRNVPVGNREPRLGVEQQLRLAPANSLMVPDPVSHKQLHTELSQRLQEMLSERSQAPECEEEVGAGAKEKAGRSVDQGASQNKKKSVGRQRSADPATEQPDHQQQQQQQAGKRAPAKRKDKGQKPLEPEPAQLTAARMKPVPTNVLRDKTHSLNVKATDTVSSKMKRDAEVAGNMAKSISGHYEISTTTTKATAENIPTTWGAPLLNRSIFDKKSWLSSAKKETAASCFGKSYSNSSRKQSSDPRDVYAFNTDTPLSNRKMSKTRTESSAIDSSDVRDPLALPTKKGQPSPKQDKRYVKKHLFSDTDTDHATTEVSWLNDSARKPKPKITIYSREGPVKTKTTAPDNNTYDVIDVPPLSAVPVKKRDSVSKKRPQVQVAVEQPETATARFNCPAAARRRPQRAAASSKTYKEPDTDDSQSESEQLPAAKKQFPTDQQERKEKIVEGKLNKKPTSSKIQPTAACRKLESDGQDSQSDVEQLAAPKQGKRSRTGQKANRAMVNEAASPEQTTKTYNKSNSDSQSESEQIPAPKKQFSTDQQERKEKIVEGKLNKKPTSSKIQPTAARRKLESDGQDSQSDVEQLAAPKQGKRSRMGQKANKVMVNEAASPEQITKTYNKSDSDSQSESEQIPAPKNYSFNVPKQIAKKTFPEITVGSKKCVGANGVKESWASRFNSFCPSPPSIEKMRSVDGSTPGLPVTFSPLPAPLVSPLSAQSGPPRPALSRAKGDLTPAGCNKRKKSTSSKNLSLLSSRPVLAPLGQTPELPDMAELSPFQRPTLSPSGCPLLTSTALEANTTPISRHISPPTTKNKNNNKNNIRNVLYGPRKDVPVSQVSLSQSSRSSVASARLELQPAAALALANILEQTPNVETVCDQQHISGPSHKNYIAAVTSNSEEDERDERKKSKKRAQYPVRMRPRKLFKSSAKTPAETLSSSDKEEENQDDETEDVAFNASSNGYQSIKTSSVSKTTFGSVEVSPEGDVSHVVVSSHVKSTTSHWEAGVEDQEEDEGLMEQPGVNMGSMCREFSSVLQRKFQSRSRRMQVYTKQSLQTVEHHVSNLSMQVSKYRTQRLEQIQAVLMDEIKNLEQDDVTLKNMEKDLTMYWKKQSTAFHSYHGNGTKRLETLKDTFQNNVCHSLDYEEEVFASQMSLMRKDMKAVQDRLFKEMQTEEMHNVRRGLQALLLPSAARF